MKIKANEYEPKDMMKIIREWTELTQKEFGKSIGKAERTIQGLELGETGYSIKTLLKIAKVHNLEITIEKENNFILMIVK